ncbi:MULTISPECIES: NAD-dependent epimerase/dehydratase family protein [Sphingobium]|uniref:NAD-dependent epimerase/dehydratase family protein n=1 Tax=Sphingobium TaxID=165695 RepID=UPI00159C2788|nr:NAD(P)-dependent oxidoreductase [Sphingobium sp. 15-1]
MAHILVTGGTGNIGMYAVAQFIDRGHDVVVYDRAGDTEMLNAVAPGATVIEGDIVDAAHIDDVVASHHIDHILHLAAFLGPASMSDPIKALDVNCLGTANIFDAALRHGVSSVCWTSSIAAIGTMPDYDGRLLDEDYRIAPTTPYGASKYYGELMSGIYRERGLDIRCIRPAFAFGLGKLTGSWGANYNRIIYQAALGQPSSFPAWSKNGLQIIYNRDQAKLCVDATLSPPGERWLYNTPTEAVFSEADFIALIEDVVPDARIVRDPRPPFGSAFPPNVDGARALEDLRFIPDYGVRAGIAEMVAYYREHPDQPL